MRVGSLFSGIGGIDLGLERAGMEIAWQVEIDEWCRQVLTKHWPDVPKYGDIHGVGAHNLAPVDVVCGGPPCQPISTAGEGKGADDERWLWPEFLRVVRELRPRYVFVENPPALLHRRYDPGSIFGELALCGYDIEWDCLPSAAFGAFHLRDRLWILAHRNGGCGGAEQEVQQAQRASVARGRGERHGAHAHSPRLERAESHGEQHRIGAWASNGDRATADSSSERPPRSWQSIFGGGASSGIEGEAALALASDLGRIWRVEPDVGRVAHGIPRRVDRLRGLGNAVVPQIVEWIGRRIMEADVNAKDAE